MERKIHLADMHMHSLKSDGSISSERMVDAVAAKTLPYGHLPVMAITDHAFPSDRTIFRYGRKHHVTVIGGSEQLFEQKMYSLADSRIEKEKRLEALDIVLTLGLAILPLMDPKKFEFLTRMFNRLDEMNIIARDMITDFRLLDKNMMQSKYAFLYPEFENEMVALGMVNKVFHENWSHTREVPTVTMRSEVLCYYPPNISDSVIAALKKLNRIRASGKMLDLQDLMDFLGNNVGPSGRDFEKMVFILAHPLSIDITQWGKLLAQMHFSEEHTQMQTYELSDPSLLKFFSGAEVKNAGHTVGINKAVEKAVHSPNSIYAGIGPSFTGNSDAHDPAWVYAAYSIIPADETSPEAILDALRTGHVKSMWGLDTIDLPLVGDISPFPLWTALSPITQPPSRDDRTPKYLAKLMLHSARQIIAPAIADRISLPTPQQVQTLAQAI